MLRVPFESQVHEGNYLCLNGQGQGSHSRGYGSASLSTDPSNSNIAFLEMNNPTKDTVYLLSASQACTYLPMDGISVPCGSGIVNCQKGLHGGTWEEFRLQEQGDGSFLVESVAFPKHCLRAEGGADPPKVSVQNWEEGGGIESDERRFRISIFLG
jgi:hypothetical protein